MTKNLSMQRAFRLLVLVGGVGVLAGSASALFLLVLNVVTQLRESFPLLMFFLPVAGLVVGLIYHFGGPRLERGTDLLLEEIHEPKTLIPWSLAPAVLLGTWITHLCGGSAGREGTAVQMGGSLAAQVARIFAVPSEDRAVLVMAGLSAGFGSVFGVPWAGAVFGLEVLRIKRYDVAVFFLCGVAAFVGHYTCLIWGVRHTDYTRPEIPGLSFTLCLALILASVAFGGMARFFTALSHALSAIFKRWIPFAPWRPVLGGVLLLLGYTLIGSGRFAGLGVPEIQQALREPVGSLDFWWKSVFTALTVGSGFKGGEVTPLLFIGTTLGNALSVWLPIPLSTLSALGFVAVFAGAANTPLACAVMAMEIFGPGLGPLALVSCGISYLVSDSSGIYKAQRGHEVKHRWLSARWRRGMQRLRNPRR